MAFSLGSLLRRELLALAVGWTAIVAAVPAPQDFSEAHYPSDAIITRDVVVLGGGASGTYAALRLGDLGKSVVVVEKKGRLGGHTETYTDPATGTTIDIGVEYYHNLPIVSDVFGRFNIAIAIADLSSPGVTPVYLDFQTGQVDVNFYPSDPTVGLELYAGQIFQFAYLEAGFYLPNPVPDELLLPFGDFVTTYGIQSAAQLIFSFAQGLSNFFQQTTLYVFKNFGLHILEDLQIGFLTTVNKDNSELYVKAQAELGQNVLLNATILATDRGGSGEYAKILVDTPTGIKLIRAKKIVFTIPPKLDNLRGFDLSANETRLFQQFGNSAYYTGLIRNSGIPDNISVTNYGAHTLYNTAALPGIYSINPTAVPGLQAIKFASAVPPNLSDAEVKVLIIAGILRIDPSVRSLPTVGPPEFAVFSSHTPFELTVPPSAIAAGFYTELYALQGQRRTFYSGAAFHAHDSTNLWEFTEALLPEIVA